MTWEKAENVPPDVIQEYEQGNSAVVMDCTEEKMGQTTHTFTIGSGQQTGGPKTNTRPVVHDNTG